MKRLVFLALVFLLVTSVSFLQKGNFESVRALSPTIFDDASDGYVDSNGVVYAPYSQMSLGDWNTNAYAACFVKFNLSGISGTLFSAMLNLFLARSIHDNVTDSFDPLASIGLGDCQVIHINDYGILDASDLFAASIGNDPGVLLSSSATPNIGYVSIDAKAAMQDDINDGRAWSTFMLRMSTNTDNDSRNDYWVFWTSEYGDPAKEPYVGYELVPEPSIYQGDLVLTGNNVTVIEGRFDINGSIIVRENATLILRDAMVNITSVSDGIFLQDPANGNPRLQGENTTIPGNTDNRIYDNSSVILSNCSINGFWYFNDETNGTIQNATVTGLQTRENSSLFIVNSTMGNLDVVTMSANASIFNLSPGFFESWDFWLNCSVESAVSGSTPHITLTQTTVNDWSFSFQGSGASEIIKSQISYLHVNLLGNIRVYNSTIGTIELYSSPIIELTNSTYSDLDFHGDAQVYSFWYLDVKVTDSVDNIVPLANVTATYPNATIAGSQLTDASGNVWFALEEKKANASGNYPIGDYALNATYETYYANTTINLTGNQQTVLKLEGLVIPEYQSFFILLVFATTTLLAVTVCKKRRTVHLQLHKRF